MFQRSINIPKSKSFFLFGPRGVGKSTLIKQQFSAESTLTIDLLSYREETRLTQDPDDLLRQVRALPAGISHIFIDEIQKIPRLLDVVHKLIEETGKTFILTGSSPRKLRHGAANLLAGRALERHLFPLSSQELGEAFNLQSVLNWGSLPYVINSHDERERDEILTSYANTYLKEEVWNEHLIRKINPFRKFLNVAAQANSKIVNFSNIAKDCGVDYKTVQAYFQILDDTLLGCYLEPYSKSLRKRVHQSPKFYFFDPGVTRALAGLLPTRPQPSTAYFGELFAQWVILEFLRNESYQPKGYRFYYYHSHDNHEIDLVIERPGKKLALVEIKSTTQLRDEMLKKFKRAKTDLGDCDAYCLSLDPTVRDFDGILSLHWQEGLVNI